MRNSKASKLGFEKHLRQNVFNWRNLKSGTQDVFEEGFSESVAQISSNILDVWSGVEGANVWDGVAESFVSGMIVSKSMKIPSLGKALSAPFRSADTNQRVGEMSEKIVELTKQAGRSDIDPKRREEIESEIIALTDKSNQLIEQDIK